MTKNERIEQIAIAADLEAVTHELATVETILASITVAVNQIVSRILGSE